MTIYEWADRLGMDPRKSKGPEDFWTICPCHDDTEPSLHVYASRKTGEIVMKCFVCGVTGAQVCETVGVPIGEVMCDAFSGEKRVRQGAGKGAGNGAAKPGRAQPALRPSYPFKTGKTLTVGGTPYEIKSVYEYRDREGRVVLRKARAELWEDGRRKDKSFLIQSLGEQGGWVSGAGLYGGLIYHLPDVLSMKDKPGLTIIAEGEKDVDNLRLLGLNATCGMHGGGIDRGGDSLLGKWNDEHSRCFDGLDQVVVIADNDAAGEGISQWICRRLKDRVKSLKLLRIAEHWPQLEKHGDFTDWANTLIKSGKHRSEIRTALETMIGETPEWTPGNIRKFEMEDRQDGKSAGQSAEETSSPEREKRGQGSGGDGGDEYPSYFGISPYCIKNGRLSMYTGQGGAKALCDFLPELKEIVLRDDGAEQATEYVISAKDPTGRPMRDAHVLGGKAFKTLDWAAEAWTCWGNVRQDIRRAESRIVDALNRAAQQRCEHRSVYVHTGMREIDGQTAYLHGGGAIGAQGAGVELDGALAGYRIEDGGHSREDAAIAERILLDSMPPHLIYPLLAQAYLAPVFSVMEALHQPPSYVVYIVGASNAGKSTVAGYVQAHFGDFYNRRFPANFNDTVNSVREKLFLAKDALVVVDDYRRSEDARRSGGMDAVADNVISAVADRADRGRLTADKKTAAARPSRCTCVMTGEDVPRVSMSRLMRLYRIDVEPGEIYRDVRTLDEFRKCAADGYYSACMYYFIADLLARWDSIRGELRETLEAMGEMVGGRIRRREGRFIECAVHLMTGVSLMLHHLERCGMMDAQEKAERLETAARIICANLDEQGRTTDEERPEMIWLQTLRSLLATRSVTLAAKDDITNGFRAGQIGFEDGDVICLTPEACDEQICERLRKGGRSLGASRQSILRALARMGMIRYRRRRDGAGIGETTIVTRTGPGKQARMIHLWRWALERDTPPSPGEQGFIPADGEQLPMEFVPPAVRRGGEGRT